MKKNVNVVGVCWLIFLLLVGTVSSVYLYTVYRSLGHPSPPTLVKSEIEPSAESEISTPQPEGKSEFFGGKDYFLELDNPYGIAYEPSDSAFYLTSPNGVHRFSVKERKLTKVRVRTEFVFLSDVLFSSPWLYLVDNGSGRVFRLSLSNGKCEVEKTVDYIKGKKLKPKAFLSDEMGYIYLLDRNNRRILKLDERLEYLEDWDYSKQYWDFLPNAGVIVDEELYVVSKIRGKLLAINSINGKVDKCLVVSSEKNYRNNYLSGVTYLPSGFLLISKTYKGTFLLVDLATFSVQKETSLKCFGKSFSQVNNVVYFPEINYVAVLGKVGGKWGVCFLNYENSSLP